MPISFHAVRSIPKTVAVVVRLVGPGAATKGAKAGDFGSAITPAILKAAKFEGKPGQVLSAPGPDHTATLIGVGDDPTAEAFRAAGAHAARSAARHKRVTVVLPDPTETTTGTAARQSLAEGVVLASYRYDTFKSESDPVVLHRVDVVGGSKVAFQDALDHGALVAGGVCWARDLVNEPGGSLTPPVFARKVASMAKDVGLKVKVWNEADIKRGKLGGLLGVNRGSDQPPRLVELTYSPSGKSTGTLAFVGKGITFDAGGLSIKTGTGMMTMKCDMGGAAAVAGAMSLLPSVAPSCVVKAFIPMTDNMLGGDATRPGDVLTIRNGKTIEVLNTDAEGRLILADALSLASEAKPDAIVDLATLTGACMVALGDKIAGLMSNNDAWSDQVKGAADRAGERVWPLPLPEDYRKHFESTVADMKNIGIPYGGALTAGLILKEFVDPDIAWAHIDIAGPGWTDNDGAEFTAGGTGFGVALLVELARTFKAPA